MANVRLKEFRIERDDEGRHPPFGLFTLSEAPSASWIVAFEACLAKHSGLAVVVSDHVLRIELPPPRAIARLIQLVQRCVDETNVQAAC